MVLLVQGKQQEGNRSFRDFRRWLGALQACGGVVR